MLPGEFSEFRSQMARALCDHYHETSRGLEDQAEQAAAAWMLWSFRAICDRYPVVAGFEAEMSWNSDSGEYWEVVRIEPVYSNIPRDAMAEEIEQLVADLSYWSADAARLTFEAVGDNCALTRETIYARTDAMIRLGTVTEV